jgi:hypothetical protein
MTATNTLVRTLVTYAIVLPVAILLGYSAGYGMDRQLIAIVGIIIAVLATPILIRWHHPLLFLTFSSSAVAFFLPGAPQFWLVMAYASFGIVVVEKALVRERRLMPASSVLLPVLFMGLVVFLTGQLTGGFGAKVFGGDTFGGRRYIFIFAGVAAFIAIISQQIPLKQAQLYITLFFVGGLANLLGSLIPNLPKPFWGLSLLFPVTRNDFGAMMTESAFAGGGGIDRYFGLTTACQAGVALLLALHGIRESIERGKFVRFSLLLGVAVLGAVGGFRSYLVLTAVLVFLVAYFEGVFRSRLVIPLAGLSALALAGLLMFADHLPMSIQRTISVLPVRVSPVAEYDAKGSSEWRLAMWRLVWPEVPKYLWLGKGLSIQGRDLESEEGMARRKGRDFEHDTQLLTGDYHSGPLTLIIPFGIWGVLVWLWFLYASIRALYLNYLYGDDALKKINTFLLAYFLAKTFHFFVIFGNFWTDFPQFTVVVAFSLALNGGIVRPAAATVVATQPLPMVHRVRQPNSAAVR